MECERYYGYNYGVVSTFLLLNHKIRIVLYEKPGEMK
jgi:hypothetical protein